MKPTVLLGLLFVFLSQDIISCGDHENFSLNQGTPVIHTSYLEELQKQFPDPNTNYNPNNRNHRGISTWQTSSLDGLQTLALTYDDGPHPTRTPRLLRYIENPRCKGNFLCHG